ncbi:hypothetical protein [Nonomuraea soli]|uniref:Uncharacterized protein n=1 Tax=Nonomuraea soli TaxID=1032476 RepID=A0A7W0CM93_9ACTN|nr:hypothetical protein [Nonomuraea soli]MBA2893570.1 hypothetical protein [Nonomuraea soli]
MPADTLWRLFRIASVGLALAATVAGLALGDAWLWVAVEWAPPAHASFFAQNGFDTLTTAALLAAALVKAALLWLILRPPARGALNRRTKLLRWLLYLAVAYALVLWIPIALFPDAGDSAFNLVLWAAIYALYLTVIRWRSRVLRAAAGAMFAIGLAAMANDLLDELDVLELPMSEALATGLTLCALTAIILTIVGQRRDGRWSRGTLVSGWLSLSVFLLVIPYNLLAGLLGHANPMPAIVMDAVGLIGTLWLAATARELSSIGGHPTDPPRAPRRAVRVTVAAIVILPIIGLIEPEQSPHLTFTGRFAGCYSRSSFGDLKPHEREAEFLCLARRTFAGVPPMFPDTLSDQQVLSYGRALCRAKDRDEQKAILTRAGSERAAQGAEAWDLVYICPEIIGATQPELLRSTAESQAAETDYIAEQNARCRDPWPRTKGVRQATANYFLFVDGDPGYLVHDPNDETTGGSDEELMDKVFKDPSGIGVDGSGALIGHVADVSNLCLTVKAFRTAPPARTAGWDQVNEVPILSRSGDLTVPYMGEGGEVGAGAPMPNLAIAGKGRYRLRVYVRVDEAGEEEHLIVVFPGASRKRVTLKG